ncbi:hypothetical protein TNCV_1253051 [Trichonephila clavipes]|nr:hypothetical protein TNCV_1253051 [Trichonephila clavipes]
MMTAVPLGLGFNLEDRDVCKCIVPLGHGSTLNSRRDSSSENDPNRTLTCKGPICTATDNDMRTSSPFAMMNFVGFDLTLSVRWY